MSGPLLNLNAHETMRAAQRSGATTVECSLDLEHSRSTVTLNEGHWSWQGQDYPYFDACFLETVESVRNFPALGPAIQGCVSRREGQMQLSPPSEPRVSIDGTLRLRLGMMPFPAGAKGVQAP
jgi:hypothetical protein